MENKKHYRQQGVKKSVADSRASKKSITEGRASKNSITESRASKKSMTARRASTQRMQGIKNSVTESIVENKKHYRKQGVSRHPHYNQDACYVTGVFDVIVSLMCYQAHNCPIIVAFL